VAEMLEARGVAFVPGGAGLRASPSRGPQGKALRWLGLWESTLPAAPGMGLDLPGSQTAEPLRSDRFLMEEMK